MYEAIAHDASLGDDRAAELKQAIDAYLELHGLKSIEDLGPAIPSSSHEEIGLQRFRLKGVPLWDVHVHNDTLIDSEATFEAYAAFREGALRSLADNYPQRVIDVVLIPDEVVPVTQFLARLGCDCDIVEVTADVYAERVWVMMAFSEIKSANARTSPQLPEEELRSAISTVLDMYPGLRIENLVLGVRAVRVSVSAQDALRLAQASHVLMVDPVTDTLDVFADRAAHVSVVNTPDVFYWHASERLGLQLRPTTILPVDSEEK